MLASQWHRSVGRCVTGGEALVDTTLQAYTGPRRGQGTGFATGLRAGPAPFGRVPGGLPEGEMARRPPECPFPGQFPTSRGRGIRVRLSLSVPAIMCHACMRTNISAGNPGGGMYTTRPGAPEQLHHPDLNAQRWLPSVRGAQWRVYCANYLYCLITSGRNRNSLIGACSRPCCTASPYPRRFHLLSSHTWTE